MLSLDFCFRWKNPLGKILSFQKEVQEFLCADLKLK